MKNSITPNYTDLDFCKEISDDDWMAFGKTPEAYFQRGFAGLEIISRLCEQYELEPRRILDFGCGHGNVTRFIVATFRDASVTGCDTEAEWLAWVSDHLGIESFETKKSILQAEIVNGPYDLIYFGSVFTHISIDGCKRLLTQIAGALSDNGIAIFTTAGRSTYEHETWSPGNAAVYKHLDPKDGQQIVRDYESTGYGFARYRHHKEVDLDWGISLATPEAYRVLVQEAGLSLVGVHEGMYGGVQDVLVVRLAS